MPLLSPVKAAVKSFIRGYENGQQARLYTRVHSNVDLDTHIREAAEWLKRGQDHGTDRGFSYGSKLGQGFLASYPETTGYIIDTFLRLAEVVRDPEYHRRAVEAGDWEISIQLKSGAVQSGIYNPKDPDPQPAVFNTGQVLIGWSALYRLDRSAAVREAGLKAAKWLVDMQEPNGHWIRGNSNRADASSTVYNVKSAWGLCAFGLAADYPPAVEAAIRNAEYTLTEQLPNGWYQHCCLENAEKPLLHTIAYAMQGMIGIGRLTARQDFIAAAKRTADSLIALMDSEGFIPGQIDRSFRRQVDWCCLTGSAQTGEVCGQLYQLTGEPKYREALERLNRYLMVRHDITNANPAIRGGVAGSWPVGGDYGRFKILNWATKFFLDSLLAEKEIKRT